MNDLTNKRNRRIRNISQGIVIAVLALALITVFLVGVSLPLLGVLIVVIGLLISIVRHHARKTLYSCPNCDHQFKISAWTDFLSPHFPGKKLLVCPSCGTIDWCRLK